VGPRQAKRLALTTEIFSAERAGTMGLAHEIVAPGDMDRAIEAIVANLLRSGPGALAEIKILFRSLGVGPITADVRSLTAQTIAGVRGRDEAREGFAAFFDKRPPGWAA
jgi:methylglutaconyl-CoA hydratase